MTAGPDQNGIGRGLPNRQFALTALADIERLRVRIGTNPRNMYEPFDSASLRLRRDPLGRFDVDGMKRLSSPFEVKADCIHYAISISEWHLELTAHVNVDLNRSKLWIIRTN